MQRCVWNFGPAGLDERPSVGNHNQLQQRSVLSLCRTAGFEKSGEDIYPELIKVLFNSVFPLVFFSCFDMKNKIKT